MPKSELVLFSDDSLLAQFKKVQFLNVIRNQNIFVQILDDNLCPKSECSFEISSDFGHLGLFMSYRTFGFEPNNFKAIEIGRAKSKPSKFRIWI